MRNKNVPSERRIVVTNLDLVTDLLSHLLKFEAFRLAGSFPAFSYFGTSCFGAFLLWRFPTLISSTRALTRASSMFVCFLGLLLTQLHADLCADSPGCLNPVAGTVVYRKLLGEASAELSKASKLTAVTVPFYLTSVRCQPTSSTTFLQSPLQLSIVLASLPVQPVAKLGFDPLVLPTCRSQFRGPVTIVSMQNYQIVKEI